MISLDEHGVQATTNLPSGEKAVPAVSHSGFKVASLSNVLASKISIDWLAVIIKRLPLREDKTSKSIPGSEATSLPFSSTLISLQVADLQAVADPFKVESTAIVKTNCEPASLENTAFVSTSVDCNSILQICSDVSMSQIAGSKDVD